MPERDGRAVGLWLLAAFSVIAVLESPTAHLLVIVAATLVAMSSDETKPYRGLLIIGGVSLIIRTVLFGLVSRGDNLVSTALIAAAEGLKFTAILACFGAFLCLTSSMTLLRLVPRFMFDAALVLNIAIVFAPQLIRAAGDIRDAQTMRGAKRRHLVRCGLVPLLATALDRSVALAESMESRGYGMHQSDGQTWPRLAVAVGILITSASATLWIMGRASILAAATTLVASVVAWAGLRALSASCKRTRYHKGRLHSNDKAVVYASIGIIATAMAMGASGLVHDNSYIPTVAATLLATSLVIPALGPASRQ